MIEGTGTTESEIRREVVELLRIGPRKGVATIVRGIRQQGAVRDESHLRLIIKTLCAHNSTWIGEFRKRATGRQRCPSSLRPLLETCLEALGSAQAPAARLTALDVIRRERKARSAGTLTVSDQRQLGLGDESRQLLAQLHDLTRKPTPMDLVLHLRCEHAYVHGLALLAAWCDRHAATVRVEADSPRVKQYLQAIGFTRVVEESVTIDGALYDGEHHVALTRIEREDQAAADTVAGRLIDLFARHIDLGESARAALGIMFAELVENVYRHAQSNYPAYVMAQAFPKTHKLHVVVADTGIGIFDSFRGADSRDVKNRASNERTAIDMALQKLVTSKTQRRIYAFDVGANHHTSFGSSSPVARAS